MSMRPTLAAEAAESSNTHGVCRVYVLNLTFKVNGVINVHGERIV